MQPANLIAATAASTAAMADWAANVRLTPAQARALRRAVCMAAAGQNVIDFGASPTIKRLVTLGLIEFSPTSNGAGIVRLTPEGTTRALAIIARQGAAT